MKTKLLAVLGATTISVLLFLISYLVSYLIEHPELHQVLGYTCLIVLCIFIWWLAYNFFKEMLS